MSGTGELAASSPGTMPGDAAPPLRVRNVSKRYGGGERASVPALADITLEIARGEMVALVGPSGCGKSTLLNVIGCIDVPTSGTVEIDGAITRDLDDDALTRLRRDRIGIVFQFVNLIAGLDVARNVALPLVLQRRTRAEIDARVDSVLAVVGMAERANAFPPQLSGGQLQRVAIARAVVHRPAIVLADEPTGNLDTANGALVLRLLRELASAGQTILMATHSSEAAAVCDRTIRMQDGRIV
jgi:putative ABC transport system ATP-binding protein